MTDLEALVHEATDLEPWGPHGKVMQDITSAAFTPEGLHQILGVLDERMRATGEAWRHVYKSLLLLEYMAKHGPLRVAELLLGGRMHRLEALRDGFEYKDAAGRDHGVNVRQRAGALVALLNDRSALAAEREKAARNAGKYGGVSAEQMRYGGGGGGSYGGYGGISYDSGDGYGAGGSGGASGAYHSYDRQASGRAGGYSGGGSGGQAGAGEPSDDPVEATRQRIARLKAAGALPESPNGGAGAASSSAAPPAAASAEGGGSGLLDTPPKQRAPKKLSDVRVDPAVAAALGRLPLPAAAPRSGGGGGSSGGGGSGGGATGIDLLGDLTDSAPAAAAAPPAAAAAGGGDWDAFTAAPAPAPAASAAAPAAGDGWAAFEAAPAPAGGQQPRGAPVPDVASLLAVPGPSPAGGPLPEDAFADFAAAPAAGGAAASASADPFAASTAVTPALASGGGLARGGSQQQHPHLHQQQQHAKLGPETARAKDPFADLGVL